MKQRTISPNLPTNEERIAALKRKIFIRHDFVDAVLDKMRELAAVEDTVERENLIITGDSGAGKSTIVKRFRTICPPISDRNADTDVVPVVYVSMPPRPTLSGLASDILDELMQTRKDSTPEKQLVRSVLALLRTVGTRILIIDEMQDIEKARPSEKEVIRNFIKTVSEKCGLSLVLVGMPELLPVVGKVRQISRRFDIMACPAWEYDERGANLLHHIEPLLQLKKDSGLADDRKLGEWIFAQAEGTIGDTLRILRLAGEHAIRTGDERITIKTLNAIPFVRHTKRVEVAVRKMRQSNSLR